jgi:hypothetical protein
VSASCPAPALSRFLGAGLHLSQLSHFRGPAHYSQVITIRGDSYRLREKRRSGPIKAALGECRGDGVKPLDYRHVTKNRRNPLPSGDARRKGRKPLGERAFFRLNVAEVGCPNNRRLSKFHTSPFTNQD